MADLILDIKTEFLKRLDKADKIIENISKKSGIARNSLSGMFTADKSIDDLIRALQDAGKEYENLASRSGRGQKTMAKNAQKIVDIINAITQTLSGKFSSSFASAMDFSKGAKSVEERKEAIQRLKKAISELDVTDKNYQNKLAALNQALRTHSSELRKATKNSNNLKTEQQQLVDVSSNLTRSLAAIFSLNQIKNYIGKIVDVRKEFELQHKSLQIIIQDQDKANELWQQTIDLGLKSPFRVKELVKYTKQLAAYRIETDKLHNATSRLADMSAGLGVDMQRLILAYGQVRAAEYLRGTELRQFTEAGVPMLDELAKYFTELEGKAVSTAEVFKRISKRMVTFADVEHVIQKMTDAGGVFYKMQEQQAQTLHGMISNLYDSIDLMMNDIGKANDDFLKNTIGVAKTVVDNWRAIATAIESIGAVMAVISINKFARGFMVAGSHATYATKNFNGLTLAGSKLNIALKAIGQTLSKNTWMIWATLITTATVAFVNHLKKVDEANKKYDELNAGVIRQIDKIAEIQEKNKEYGKTIEENNKTINDSASSEEQVLEARRENSKILKLLIEAYPDVYSGIKQNENGTIELTKAINEQNEALERQLLLNNLNKGNFWLEDFQKNYSDVKSSIGEVEFAIIKMQSATANMRADLKLANQKGIIDDAELENLEDYIDAIKNAKTEEEALYAFNKVHGLAAGFGVGDIITKYLKNYSLLYRETNDLQKKLDTLGQNLSNHIDYIKVEISKFDDVGKASFIDKYIEQLGVADERTKEFAREFITKKIGIELTFVDAENKSKEYTTKDFVYGWQHTLYEAFQKIEQTDKTLALRLGIGIDDIALANDAEEIRDKVEPILQSIVDEQQGIAKWKGKTGQLVYSQEAIENAEDAEKQLRKIGELLAITFKKEKDGGRDGEDIYARRIKLIRDMAKAYERLNKSFAADESQTRVIESYSDAFKDLFDGIMDIQDVKFTTPKGVVAALKVLEESGKLTAKQMRDVKKAIAEVSTEIDEAAQKISGEQMTKSIEDMFGKYELSLELQKLDIPQDFAKELFDIDVSSLGDITAKINKELASGMWGKEVEDKLKEFQRKVAEMEAKEQAERLKTYLKYTRDAIGERAKIKLEELRKLDEIEQTFEKQKRMADVATGEYERLEEAKQRAILGVKKEALAEMQKLEWEQFKSSDVFINMFNDLDNASTKAIDSMIDQLEKYKKEWSNLPIDQMKEVAKQLERMKKAMAERDALYDPFKGGFMKAPNADERERAEQNILIANKTLKDIKDAIAITELKMLEYAEGKHEMSVKEYRQLKEKRAALLANLAITEDYILEQQGVVDEYEKQIIRLNAQSAALGKCYDMAKDLYDAFRNLSEALGVDEDSPAMIFADMGMNMAEAVMQAMQLHAQVKIAEVEMDKLGIKADTFGWKLNKAMGVIGWIVMGVQLLATGIKAAVEAHDNSLQDKIEFWQDNVEGLQKSYEDLSEAVDEAYSLTQLEQYTMEMQHLNNQMINAYKEMIYLEEAKKRTDNDAIKEMRESISQLEKENEEVFKNMFSEATDGILDSAKDAARDFTDAWFDAFKETGDGMKGLEDTFNEMIANMIKQQITMSIVSPYLEKWKKQLEKYIDTEKGDLTLSIDEANEFAETVKNEMPYLNESLENAFRPVADLVNLYGDAGNLTGLQKGIQGITETQAEEISAYLNSIRFFISQQNDTLLNLAQRVLSVNDAENPIVAQLRIIATQTTAINELLNSLTTPFGGGGRGFKVVI